MLKFLSKILYPYYCANCEKELKDDYLCDDCVYNIKTLNEQVCPVCEKPSVQGITHRECKTNTSLDRMFVAINYKDKLARRLIHLYKYGFVKLLCEPLSSILIKSLENNGVFRKNAKNRNIVITSVPLHPIRHRWRGFNQSEIIAKKVARHFGCPYADLLVRVKNNSPQKSIPNTRSRRQNVENIFRQRDVKTSGEKLSDNFKKSTIVIVDDIATTLSTLNECAKTLKLFEPEKIYAVIIARNI